MNFRHEMWPWIRIYFVVSGSNRMGRFLRIFLRSRSINHYVKAKRTTIKSVRAPYFRSMKSGGLSLKPISYKNIGKPTPDLNIGWSNNHTRHVKIQFSQQRNIWRTDRANFWVWRRFCVVLMKMTFNLKTFSHKVSKLISSHWKVW